MTTTTERPTASAIGKCRKCKAPHRFTFPTYGKNNEPRAFWDDGTPENVYSWAWNEPQPGHTDTRPTCRECGHQGPWKLRPLKGRHNPDKKCNPRCVNATGPNCECSCGGDNHGGSYQV